MFPQLCAFGDMCYELAYAIIDFLDETPAEQECVAELRKVFDKYI